MNDLSGEAIAEIASGALESMAFMVLDAGEAAGAAEAGVHARIRYRMDDESSALFLSASEGFVAELASAMLGVEPEDVLLEEEGAQALTELANILAGEVGRVLGAESRPFEAGIPESVAKVPEPDGEGSRVECHLDCMGETLSVVVVRTTGG